MLRHSSLPSPNVQMIPDASANLPAGCPRANIFRFWRRCRWYRERNESNQRGFGMQVNWLQDGDHGLKPPKTSGQTEQAELGSSDRRDRGVRSGLEQFVMQP